jgi:hypothetical protein
VAGHFFKRKFHQKQSRLWPPAGAKLKLGNDSQPLPMAAKVAIIIASAWGAAKRG